MTTHASSLMTGAPLSLSTALLRNSSTVVLKGVIGIASGLSLHLSKGVTLSHSACITHRVSTIFNIDFLKRFFRMAIDDFQF